MEDQWDPVRQGGLHGPHFSTAGWGWTALGPFSILNLRWDQEFRVGKAPGLHPVEMLARIAKFEVVGWEKHFPKKRPKYLSRENLSPATSHTLKTFEAEAALARSASRAS